MQLSVVGFADLVRRQVAAAQGSAGRLLDFSVGAVLRALVEANAKIALWLQWQALDILRATRLASSSGDDVDTFVNDFNFSRLPAAPASGVVTLSRLVPIGTATVLVGGTVRTADSAQTFVVTADSANPAWNATLGSPDPTTGLVPGGYTAQDGVASIDVPVAAAVAGTTGNIDARALTLPGVGISGFDGASNALRFTNGIAAETDDAVKARFPLYIQGLSKATLAAIEAAISSVREGLTYSVAVNVDETGAWRPGRFIVTVDDGSGNPSDDTLAAVYAAVDEVRALAETFAVHRPTVRTISVALTVAVRPGVVRAPVVAQVASALSSYLGGIGIGGVLPYSRLAAVAYAASPSVANVTGVTMTLSDGTTSTDDINPGPSGLVRASTITVN